MTASRREKGRARFAQRPFDFSRSSPASCPTGVTCQCPDGDAQKVSRNALEFKCAVAEFHGDGHESAQSFRT